MQPDEVAVRQLRRKLLREPGVRLLSTKTRRGERLDFVAYKEPGGPPRPTFFVVHWRRMSWDPAAFMTRREAAIHYERWGKLPPWYREPRTVREP